jgi:hypothetical protein
MEEMVGMLRRNRSKILQDFRSLRGSMAILRKWHHSLLETRMLKTLLLLVIGKIPTSRAGQRIGKRLLRAGMHLQHHHHRWLPQPARRHLPSRTEG